MGNNQSSGTKKGSQRKKSENAAIRSPHDSVGRQKPKSQKKFRKQKPDKDEAQLQKRNMERSKPVDEQRKDKPPFEKTKDQAPKVDRLSPKRLSVRKQRERIEREKKMQRVTKEQLRRISGTLQRTSWYLGRRLGMDNSQATRYQTGFATEDERKYQMLLWWRRVHGWKATSQRLVILLELGNYTEEEYAALLATTNEGISIYDKPPAVEAKKPERNDKRELYHADASTKSGVSYGNGAYGSVVEAQDRKKTKQKGETSKTSSKRKEQKRSQGRESLNSTLPPWWNRSIDNINIPIGVVSQQVQADKKKQRRSRKQAIMTDGNASQTDDSGIVTSPPTSPSDIPTGQSVKDKSPKRSSRNINSQSERTRQECFNEEMTHAAEQLQKTTDSKQALNKLVVRRCSDSVVKMRRTSAQKTHPREPPIGNTDVREVIVADNGVTSGQQTLKQIDERTGNDGTEVMVDTTNGNAIKRMIDRYETLTKTNRDKKRESMAESIARYYEWNTLQGSLAGRPTSSQYASKTSLNSYAASQRSGRGSVASSHNQTRFSVQRFHYFTFGGKGRFPSRFKGLISGLAILKDDSIVASDGENKRVQIFDKRGRFQTTFDTNTELKPKGLCVTPDQSIAVCCGDSVNVYDREGKMQLSFGQGVFRNNSYCVCCDKDNNYYVSDIVTHTISIHDAQGRIRKRFGFEGTSMIHFNQPVALAINSKNKLFITDSQNHCIKVYKLSGRPLFRIGAQGSADGLFWNPLGICIDREDNLYVADCGNNRISQFNSDGQFLRHLLSEKDGIWMPSLVQVNSRGQLVVCEWEKQIIKVFTIETDL